MGASGDSSGFTLLIPSVGETVPVFFLFFQVRDGRDGLFTHGPGLGVRCSNLTKE
jgi:hypothetical protein